MDEKELDSELYSSDNTTTIIEASEASFTILQSGGKVHLFVCLYVCVSVCAAIAVKNLTDFYKIWRERS